MNAPSPPAAVEKSSITKELLAGLTVSFVAISLGAAFGVMSERGALAGILSAGVIALITAAFGGTRIQCSGPTAPMTAVTAAMVAVIHDGALQAHPGADPDQFINMVLVLTGAILVLAGAFRLGRFISVVPRVVISGFMNGIALLIWVGEAKTLFGWSGKEALSGGLGLNLAIAGATLFLVFFLPSQLKKLDHRLAAFLPATLVTIVVITAFAWGAGLGVQRVQLGATLSGMADLMPMFEKHIPTQWSVDLVLLGLPFALQLAMLAYLDTLLTSLVVDKKVQKMFGTNEVTAQNQELVAQGVANAAVATFGGIPGAQATIRSVLILNEGAMTRLAGVMVGVFVLVEMLMFQSLITLIPQAVFSGVLIKVGYDVFDWTPVSLYWDHLKTGDKRTGIPDVPHLDMFFIAGTTLLTVAVNLNVAVVSFSVLFFVMKRFVTIRDLKALVETEGFADEG